MALRLAGIWSAAGLSFALVLVALASDPATSTAQGDACERWGDSTPERLSGGQARDAVRCLINEERRRRGLPGLDRDARLQKAAQRHSERMDGTGCFSHECPREPDLAGRLRGADYLRGELERWAFAENVAWGLRERATPRAVVDAWMGSAGHRANMLNRTFREIGIGFAAGSPSRKRDPGGIYTVDFGLAVG